MKEEQLLQLKGKIDKAKAELHQLTGAENQLLRQLEQDWNSSSLEEAEMALDEMETQLRNLNMKIEKLVAKIREDFPSE